MSAGRDRRLTPATERVAHVSLRGAVEAPAWTEGSPARVVLPVADLLARPSGPRDRQVLYGAAVTVIERRQGHAFVLAAADGYCGWLAEAALGPAEAATHWISARASHLYREPSLKAPEAAGLSFGARLRLVAEAGRFAETADGWFVPRAHLLPLGDWLADPVEAAMRLLGAPYLWGGNSQAGVDCSGLVQLAFHAAGRACPGDSDLQRAAFGPALPEGTAPARGDLFFWPGHVALAVDGLHLIHANGFRAAVTLEGIETCLARIEAQGEGPLLCHIRPD